MAPPLMDLLDGFTNPLMKSKFELLVLEKLFATYGVTIIRHLHYGRGVFITRNLSPEPKCV